METDADQMYITVNGVSFAYGSAPILKDVNLSLDKSEVLGIIGPNGSGKTTLIKCINRILTPQQGEIAIDGEDALKMSLPQISKKISYVPQNAVRDVSSPMVYEVVMMGRRPHTSWKSTEQDEEIVWKAMVDMGVEDLATKPFDRLSSGQTQRVLLARAIAQEAEIFLLDEPTSNLDIRYQLEVMGLIRRLVREKGVGVCAIVHDIDLAMKYCDKLVMLDEGRITYAGTAEEVITVENIKETYGVDIAIDHNYGRPHVVVL
ncbi:MAG: ABC transporter ATP-binding protein [Thermoplasmatales archaeon]|nr:ABC transporter ATP-binding protein [Thermoplasmatales archaeon]